MKTKPVSIGSHSVGGSSFTLLAGPCSIENEKQFETISSFIQKKGVHGLRGGIYKLRTNPVDFQGLEKEAFPIVKKIKSEINLPFVTEITDPRQIEEMDDFVDIYQVGTRNMFNYSLLKELGKSTKKPILLKRAFSARIKEWLLATDYIAREGNENIILCERGVRNFETQFRNTLDFNAVAFLKKETHFPVLVDPSHGTGDSSLVIPLAKGAVAVGADGLLVEVHKDVEKALSDGAQSLNFEQFTELTESLKKILPIFNKTL